MRTPKTPIRTIVRGHGRHVIMSGAIFFQEKDEFGCIYWKLLTPKPINLRYEGVYRVEKRVHPVWLMG